MANQTPNSTIIARASHVLSSPRKTNLVLKAIVGRPATLAIKQLSVHTKRAGKPIVKLIQQAIGNAVSQFHASPDQLIIDTAYATKGRTLKRAHIGGRGRTKPYERITSHLTLKLRLPSTQVSMPKPETVKPKAELAKSVAKPEKTKTKKGAIKSTKKTN